MENKKAGGKVSAGTRVFIIGLLIILIGAGISYYIVGKEKNIEKEQWENTLNCKEFSMEIANCSLGSDGIVNIQLSAKKSIGEIRTVVFTFQYENGTTIKRATSLVKENAVITLSEGVKNVRASYTFYNETGGEESCVSLGTRECT